MDGPRYPMMVYHMFEEPKIVQNSAEYQAAQADGYVDSPNPADAMENIDARIKWHLAEIRVLEIEKETLTMRQSELDAQKRAEMRRLLDQEEAEALAAQMVMEEAAKEAVIVAAVPAPVEPEPEPPPPPPPPRAPRVPKPKEPAGFQCSECNHVPFVSKRALMGHMMSHKANKGE